jgi:hypothetical protein
MTIPDSILGKTQLVKKFHLVAAQACLRLQDYDRTQEHLQKSCELIMVNDRDQLKVYFLAFKMQCQLKDKDGAMAVFQQILTCQHVTAEPIIECFDVLVQNNLTELALALGSHFLKNLDKFVLEFQEQKSFILKFIFQFDKVS